MGVDRIRSFRTLTATVPGLSSGNESLKRGGAVAQPSDDARGLHDTAPSACDSEGAGAVRPLERERLAMPASAGIMISYLGLQSCLSVWLLLLGVVGLCERYLRDGRDGVIPMDVVALAPVAWPAFYLVVSVKLVLGVSDQKPWAWACSFALLFWRLAASLLYLILMLLVVPLVNPIQTLPFVIVMCLWVTLHYFLVASLFRSRLAFGIGAREGWRTLRMKGGWALIAFALFELSPPLYLGYYMQV